MWLVLCVISSWQQSEATEKLHIYTEHFAPYNFLQNQEIVGINVDLVKLACARANIHCEFELLSWTRAFKFAQENPVGGLVSVSRTPVRETKFNWVGPLVKTQACFYKLKWRTDIPVLNKRLLKNYTIGLMRNDVYQSVLNSWGLVENDDYLVYADRYEDIRAFELGKLDLILASSYTLGYYLLPSNIDMGDVEPVFYMQDPSLKGNYLALNKAVPDSLVLSLQHGLAQIPVTETQKLILKYVISAKNQTLPTGALRRCYTY